MDGEVEVRLVKPDDPALAPPGSHGSIPLAADARRAEDGARARPGAAT